MKPALVFGRDLLLAIFTIGIILTALLCMFWIVKLVHNEQVRSSPPIQCQVFGGHWSPWNGWQCKKTP